jgi:thiol-disulfide isomerase/thioredoxin
MELDRRSFIALGASVALAPAPPLEAAGLPNDPLAHRFQPMPAHFRRPTGVVISASGNHTFGDLRAKLRIVSLWAEWCAPCLFEMRDLAALGQRHARQGFEVLPVLTSSGRHLSWRDADALLAAHGASLSSWVEPGGAADWLNCLGTRSGEPTLPCNLLVDRSGRIVGRLFGASPAAPLQLDNRAGRLTEAGKAQLAATEVHSVWARPMADTFVDAWIRGN